MPDHPIPLDNFHESFDAMDWTKAWLRIIAENPAIPTDEGTMIGWFANALMRGWDEHARRRALRRGPCVASRQTPRPAPPSSAACDLCLADIVRLVDGPSPGSAGVYDAYQELGCSIAAWSALTDHQRLGQSPGTPEWAAWRRLHNAQLALIVAVRAEAGPLPVVGQDLIDGVRTRVLINRAEGDEEREEGNSRILAILIAAKAQQEAK